MNPEKPADDTEDIIDLTRVVKSKPQPAVTGEPQDQPLSTEDLTQFDEKDNDLGKLVADVVGGPSKEDTEKTTASGKIAMDRIEATLEKVVKKLYSKKIEDMVMDVIEKTVKEEIQKIKEIIKEQK